jgi:hypothetical protein
MGLYGVMRCKLGHKHRNTPTTWAQDTVASCDKRTDKALAKLGWSLEGVCERCARKARTRGGVASTNVRECPGCRDKVCPHFFPLDAKVCYSCKDGVL